VHHATAINSLDSRETTTQRSGLRSVETGEFGDAGSSA